MSGIPEGTDNPINPQKTNNGNTTSVEETIESSLLDLSRCGSFLNAYLLGDGSPREGFEEEISDLWEMSAIEDYVHIFERHEFKSVMFRAILTIPSLRIVEICLGILGNLSMNGHIMRDLSQSPEMINIIKSLTICDEARVLVQVFRFLHSALSSEDCRHCWTGLLDSEFFPRLLFILHSSTLGDLLKVTLNTFDVILYNRLVEIGHVGAPGDVVAAVFSAFYQLQTEDTATFDLTVNIIDSLTEEYFSQHLTSEFIQEFITFSKWIVTTRCDSEFSLREELCRGGQRSLLRFFCFVGELTSGCNREECRSVVSRDSAFVDWLRNFLPRVGEICAEFEDVLKLILESLE